KRNDTFYFSRSTPSNLQHRFKKRKTEVYLLTKSELKAAKPAAALTDRLERYWKSIPDGNDLFERAWPTGGATSQKTC
ncbi:MAG: DUF6538 domain-containing protein, partial [Candidatus Puniceispirillum sp.]